MHQHYRGGGHCHLDVSQSVLYKLQIAGFSPSKHNIDCNFITVQTNTGLSPILRTKYKASRLQGSQTWASRAPYEHAISVQPSPQRTCTTHVKKKTKSQILKKMWGACWRKPAARVVCTHVAVRWLLIKRGSGTWGVYSKEGKGVNWEYKAASHFGVRDNIWLKQTMTCQRQRQGCKQDLIIGWTLVQFSNLTTLKWHNLNCAEGKSTACQSS